MKNTLMSLSVSLFFCVNAFASVFEDIHSQINDLSVEEGRELVKENKKSISESERYYFEGTLCGRNREFKDAVKLLKKATDLEPDRSIFWSKLGVAYANRGSEVMMLRKPGVYGNALDSFEKSVELDPENVEGLKGLIQYKLSAPPIAGGDKQKGLELAEQLKDLSFEDGWILTAFAYQRMEQFEKALECYQHVVDEKGDEGKAFIYVRMGKIHEELERYELAEKNYRHALVINPDLKWAQNSLDSLLQKIEES